MSEHANGPRLVPLAPNEPTGVLSTSIVLLELARLEFDCDEGERAGIIRARDRIRELAGIPAAHA